MRLSTFGTRVLTLNEYDDDSGMAMVMLLNRKHWADPVTEVMKLGTTEIWSLASPFALEAVWLFDILCFHVSKQAA